MNDDATGQSFFSTLEEGVAHSADSLEECFHCATNKSNNDEHKRKFERACILIEKTGLRATNESEHQEFAEALRIAVEYVDEGSTHWWRELLLDFPKHFRQFDDNELKQWGLNELKENLKKLILELDQEFVKLQVFPRTSLNFEGKSFRDGDQVILQNRNSFHMLNKALPSKYYRITATRANGEVVHQISDGHKWEVGVSPEEADAHLQTTRKD